MANTLNTLDHIVGGAVLAPSLATNFTSSRTWTAPQDGIVVVRAMGAGGGGARGATNATGGYSGSWGAKAVRVKKNDTVVVSIGAAGVGRTGTDGNGTSGGDTTVVIGGVTYIAYGGPGGKAGAVSAIANGPSPSSNWDFGAASVKPGWAAGSMHTGGAGVDILAQGNNATTSSTSIDGTGGGGTGGASVGTTGGGAIGITSALGQAAATPGVYLDASNGEWGLSFYGGSGSNSAGVVGGNGGGGGGANGGGGGGRGVNGGGGGGANSGAGGNGGYGAGGGGGTTAGGGSEGGYAHLKFLADLGI